MTAIKNQNYCGFICCGFINVTLRIIIGVNSRKNTAAYTFNNINIKKTGPDWIVGK